MAAALALGFAGVVALVGLDLNGTSVLSLVEIAGVIVGYAVGPIVLARSLRGLPALGVVDFPPSAPPAKVIASVIGLALVCTALAFIVFFALIAEVGPVRATVITIRQSGRCSCARRPPLKRVDLHGRGEARLGAEA